ncbi:MAG TPA: monovalent cation/H(+) antiporter subunit G [Actinomycetaceae bacterium]|nr:monovalent cation/H(+) antiporter subunit G [Actinomycetaceae bacterium]
MNWDMFWDAFAAFFLVLGTFLTVAAAIGMLRFPDLLSRLHATSKPQSLGLALMMIGFSISMRSPSIAWTAVLIVLLQIVTAPIGAHLAGRAGYRTGQVDSRTLHTDEYRRDIAAALRAEKRQEQKKRDRERAEGAREKRKRGRSGGSGSKR